MFSFVPAIFFVRRPVVYSDHEHEIGAGHAGRHEASQGMVCGQPFDPDFACFLYFVFHVKK